MNKAMKIAECILNECGSLSTMKLQKLVFYSQAAHLVEYGTPLFDEDIEAWANGPVVRSLYWEHRGRFVISSGFFGSDRVQSLNAREGAIVNRVIACLDRYKGSELSEFTHREAPWSDARKGVDPASRSDAIISKDSIRRFYSSLDCKNPLFIQEQ